MSNDTVISHRPESDTFVKLNNNALPVILTLMLIIFFFLGFFSLYFCRYLTGPTGLFRPSPTSNTVEPNASRAPGLDPSIVKSFPTFAYSLVKSVRQDKSRLECAVCLSEYEDDDIVRLITLCNHVFHPDCIDLWLESHTTCPVCRRNLDTSEKSPDVSITIPDSFEEEEGEPLRSQVQLQVEEMERGERRGEENDDLEEKGGGHVAADRFSRSHSTGHSIVRGDDRFTLILPEHLKERITKGHNLTGSCTTFGEFSGDVTIGKSGLRELSGFSGGDVTRV